MDGAKWCHKHCRALSRYSCRSVLQSPAERKKSLVKARCLNGIEFGDALGESLSYKPTLRKRKCTVHSLRPTCATRYLRHGTYQRTRYPERLFSVFRTSSRLIESRTRLLRLAYTRMGLSAHQPITQSAIKPFKYPRWPRRRARQLYHWMTTMEILYLYLFHNLNLTLLRPRILWNNASEI